MNLARIEKITRDLLLALGEDPNRPGLRETPRRVARFWSEFLRDTGDHGKTFEGIQTDQMVVVRGVRVWSLCEHHLLPFSSTIAIGYLTGDRVLGLSKFARIADKHARRLQIQERLVTDIADEIARVTESPDVAVVARGVHLCMVMRGAKSEGEMLTSVMRGRFREGAARAEFLALSG